MSKDFVPEIGSQELKQLLDRGESVLLLDVREPEENQLVAIKPSVLIPLMELETKLEDVRKLTEGKQHLVAYCRVGGRSEMAVQYLEASGVLGVKNLRGGINAYAEEADTSLNPY
ncbi:hypothetical protein BVY02_02145 [bacterium J17]|nr:hypothetical protein BVY02_02145 [bacterium J17]